MRLPRTFCLLSLATVLSVGCRTTNDRQRRPLASETPDSAAAMPPTVANTAGSANGGDARLLLTAQKPALAKECPQPQLACGQEASPAICTASSYDKKPMAANIRPVAWGANACAARQLLLTTVCQGEMLPSKLGEITCAPDVSSGQCPPLPLPCADAGRQMLCSAAGYDDQKLASSSHLVAIGSTECGARSALAMMACRQNLNPALLRGVICKEDLAARECPPSETSCDEKPRGATCIARRLEGQTLQPALEAKAPTGCAAKQALARQACERRGRPSTLDDISCTYAK